MGFTAGRIKRSLIIPVPPVPVIIPDPPRNEYN
jgi:hypothetical protein